MSWRGDFYEYTGCDDKSTDEEKGEASLLYEHDELVKTPGGGLPSIITVCIDGMVTLHSLTVNVTTTKHKDRNSNNSKYNYNNVHASKTRPKRKEEMQKSEVVELWCINC